MTSLFFLFHSTLLLYTCFNIFFSIFCVAKVLFPLQRKLFASKRRHDMELEEDDYTLKETFLPFYSVDLCNIIAFSSKTTPDLFKENLSKSASRPDISY